MKEVRSLKPLLIYRIPDRIGLFRSFGLFCLGHSIAWTGITWAWFSGKVNINVPNLSLEKWKRPSPKDGDDANQSTAEKFQLVQSIESKIPKFLGTLETHFQSIRESNADTATKFRDSLRPWMDSVSTFIQQNRDNLLSGMGALLATTTLLGGYFLPRRVVRQLTLLPLRSPISSPNPSIASKMQQLVEISTYDSFGFRSSGITLVVPVSSVKTKVDPSKKHFVTLNVQNYVFPFILQTEDAEFPEPEEFEYTFVSEIKQ